jgi:hypothetical protein
MKKTKSCIAIILVGITCWGCSLTDREIKEKSQSEGKQVFSEVSGEVFPPQGVVELAIKASIKTHLEGYYPIHSKDSHHGKAGYPFILNIDGQAAIWKVDGHKEVLPLYDEKKVSLPEGGEGMKYVLGKKIWLAPGGHTFFYGLPDENFSTEFSLQLEEGKTNVLELKPFYRKKKGTRSFLNGLRDYEIVLNGTPIK